MNADEFFCLLSGDNRKWTWERALVDSDGKRVRQNVAVKLGFTATPRGPVALTGPADHEFWPRRTSSRHFIVSSLSTEHAGQRQGTGEAPSQSI